MSLLKPTATKAQKVRGLTAANRAIKMKIIRAFSRLFSPSSRTSKDRTGRSSSPAQKDQSKFIRLFVPRSFLVKREQKRAQLHKGKEKEETDSDEKRDSKSVLDLPTDGVVIEVSRDRTRSPSETVLVQANGSPQSSPYQPKGILRLRLKKEEATTSNGAAKEPDPSTPTRGSSFPAGVVVVEDPAWSAARQRHSGRPQDPHTPPRTPTGDPKPTTKSSTKGKSRGEDVTPISKSLITAYETGFTAQDANNKRQKERGQGVSWFKQKETEKNQFLQVQQQHSISPPVPARTPPNEIGLALTTDDISIISEISRRNTPASLGHLSPNFLKGLEEDDDEKRKSWRLPNGILLGDDNQHQHQHQHPESPKSINTIKGNGSEIGDQTPSRVTSISSNSTVNTTPTRIITSPSRLRRSPNFDPDDMVEFNVLVRPGDALYNILVEQEHQQHLNHEDGDGQEMEIESEIEYYTADEIDDTDDDRSSVVGNTGIDDDDDDESDAEDADLDGSDTGTIRAVEIASEGGTMRGVEIVGKKKHHHKRAMDAKQNWGFSDVLVGSRR